MSLECLWKTTACFLFSICSYHSLIFFLYALLTRALVFFFWRMNLKYPWYSGYFCFSNDSFIVLSSTYNQNALVVRP
jgi:hypothetical protein